MIVQELSVSYHGVRRLRTLLAESFLLSMKKTKAKHDAESAIRSPTAGCRAKLLHKARRSIDDIAERASANSRDRTCTVQVLVAARFTNSGESFDIASWIHIWGPARTILQQCVGFQSLGGVIVENGSRGETQLGIYVLMILLGRRRKIEIVVYDERSKYGLTRVIKESSDPVARTIALNEYIDLMGAQRRLEDQLSTSKNTGSSDSKLNATLTARRN
ncbi:MAG: hypothetical protein Q9195_009335 [Heterodermia aff. obscurata]